MIHSGATGDDCTPCAGGGAQLRVAVANLTPPTHWDSVLPLSVGDLLQVHATAGDWLLCSMQQLPGTASVSKTPSDELKRGWVPANFVRPLDQCQSAAGTSCRKSSSFAQGSNVEQSAAGVSDDPLLAEEIAAAVRTWWAIAKQQYVLHGIETVLMEMGGLKQLIMLRREVLSRSLPVDHLRKTRLTVARLIDAGNSRLKCDTVVRCADGRPLEPQCECVISVYQKHLLGAQATHLHTKRLRAASDDCAWESGGELQRAGGGGASLLVKLAASLHRLPPNVQLLCALYEPDRLDGHAFVSETLALHYPSECSPDRPAYLLFTGLSMRQPSEVDRRVVLVIRLVKLGPMEAKEATFPSKRLHSHAARVWDCPLAALDVTHFLLSGAAAAGGTSKAGGATAAGLNHDRIEHTAGGQQSGQPAARRVNVNAAQQRFVPFYFCGETGEPFELQVRRALTSRDANPFSGAAVAAPGAQQESAIGVAGDRQLAAMFDAAVDANKNIPPSRESVMQPISISISRNDSVVENPLDSVPAPNKEATSLIECATLTVQLLEGSNVAEVTQKYPYLAENSLSVVKTIGFPRHLASDEQRHELYVTLLQCDVSQSRSSERNVEVAVTLCDEKGNTVPNSIVTPGKTEQHLSNTHYGLVLYHDTKPKWSEISLPASCLDNSHLGNYHLRFVMRHRSSKENYSKDGPNQRPSPFALCWLRLVEESGAAIGDGVHQLLVYKVDQQCGAAKIASTLAHSQVPGTYVSLPSRLSDWERINQAVVGAVPARGAIHAHGYQFSNKDSFRVRSVFCSRNITQCRHVHSLLQWDTKRLALRHSLERLAECPLSEDSGEQLIYRLEKVLDAIFGVMEKLDEKNEYDSLAFDVLVQVVHLLDWPSYTSFKAAFDKYLCSQFSACLIHRKLIKLLTERLKTISKSDGKASNINLLNTIQSLPTLLKIVIQSWMLHDKSGKKTPQDYDNFITSLIGLLGTLGDLMCSEQRMHNYQELAFKCLPSAVRCLLRVAPSGVVASCLIPIFTGTPVERMPAQRMQCLRELMVPKNRADYTDDDYRNFSNMAHESALRGTVLNHIKECIESELEMQLCGQILGEMLIDLNEQRKSGAPSAKSQLETECGELIRTCLRPVMQAIVRVLLAPKAHSKHRNERLLQQYTSLLTALLHDFSVHQYRLYVDSDHNTDLDRHDFCLELLLLCRDLVGGQVYPKTWVHMCMMMNRSIARVLTLVSSTLKERFSGASFIKFLWEHYLVTCVDFLTQDVLQIEKYDQAKADDLLRRYKDLREIAAAELRSMWFFLQGVQKLSLLYALAKPVLLASLASLGNYIELTSAVLADMLMVQYSLQHNADHVKSLERHVVESLDEIVGDRGWGDRQIALKLVNALSLNCMHMRGDMKRSAEMLIDTVRRLLQRLFQFRQLRRSPAVDSAHTRMSCVVSLLEFCESIEHDELYAKYVHKLYKLHVDVDNKAEAALALQLHVRRLQWKTSLRVSDPLRKSLAEADLPSECGDEMQLKAALCERVVELLHAAEHWEQAARVCKKLQEVYEREMFDYDRLSALLHHMADLYANMAQKHRPQPEYFRVAFYGGSWPDFLDDGVFVFRGNAYDTLPSFTDRLLNVFPDAKLHSSIDDPSTEQKAALKSAGQQLLQVISVAPRPSELDEARALDGAHDKIRWYYNHNGVAKFTFSRKVRRPCQLADAAGNEFAEMGLKRTVLSISYPLPGILRFFPVVSSQTLDLHPIQAAVEDVQNRANSLTDCVRSCRTEAIHGAAKTLQMQLSGMLNPAVMGGIKNYRALYRVWDCPLIESALFEWFKKSEDSQENLAFNQFLLEKFNAMKKEVEEEYGAKESLLPPGATLEIAHCRSVTPSVKSQVSIDASSVENSPAVNVSGAAGTPKRALSVSGCVEHSTLLSGHGGHQRLLSMGNSFVPFRSPLLASSHMISSIARARNTTTPTSGSHKQSRLSNVSNATTSTVGSDLHDKIVLDQQLTPQRPLRPPKPPKKTSQSTHSDQDSLSVLSNKSATVISIEDQTQVDEVSESNTGTAAAESVRVRVNLDAENNRLEVPIPPARTSEGNRSPGAKRPDLPPRPGAAATNGDAPQQTPPSPAIHAAGASAQMHTFGSLPRRQKSDKPLPPLPT